MLVTCGYSITAIVFKEIIQDQPIIIQDYPRYIILSHVEATVFLTYNVLGAFT